MSEVKRLHWTDMGMCRDAAPDDRPLYVRATDYDAALRTIRELEAERERFERWAKRRGYPIERDHSGEYLWSTECRWEGWQARARVRVKPK